VRVEKDHEPMDQAVSSMAGLTMSPVILSPARDAGRRRSPEAFTPSSSTRKIASTFACGGRVGRSFGRPCSSVSINTRRARMSLKVLRESRRCALGVGDANGNCLKAGRFRRRDRLLSLPSTWVDIRAVIPQ
jgi:hypothetical protein